MLLHWELSRTVCYRSVSVPKTCTLLVLRGVSLKCILNLFQLMDVSVDLWKTYSKMDPVSLEDLLFEVMQGKNEMFQSSY